MEGASERNAQTRLLSATSLCDAGVLALVCIAFFWKLTLTRQYTYLDSPDLAYQVLPWLQFQASEWRQGRLPLWDPCLWAGQPLIGQAQPGTAYPLNWILFSLPLRDGYIRLGYLHWYFVVIHILAAWFCYLLCRDLGRSRVASALAGLVFSLGGWLGQMELPQMVNSAIWTPLVLLFLLRVFRGCRPYASAAAAGSFYGLSWLAGHHQIPIFIGLAVAGLWVWAILRSGKPDWKLLRTGALFLLFSALVSALQTLPAYEYGRLALRWVSAESPRAWDEPVPYVVHSEFSLHASSLVGLLVPGHGRHVDVFIGLTTLALAIAGLALGWREMSVRVLAAIASFGLLYSLGRNNVFQGLIYALFPLVEKARTPAFAIFIYHFGIACLTAWGIDKFSIANSPWPKRVSLTLFSVGGALIALGLVLAAVQKMPADDRFLAVALSSMMAAGVLSAWLRGQISARLASLTVGGLIVVELGNVAGYYWPHREDKNRNQHIRSLAQHNDLALFIRNYPVPLRCQASDTDIPYNFGDWHRLDYFGGYTASLPANFFRFPWATEKGKRFFGVNCLIAKSGPPGFIELYRSSSGLGVFYDPQASPRVWVVHRAIELKSPVEIDPTFMNPSFDPRLSTFLLEPPPALEECAGAERVELIQRTSDKVVIRAELSCRGMVILNDTFFPGWKVNVDGRPARLWEAYGVVRGVVVEAGTHHIEMSYRPFSVVLGFVLTCAGIIGAVVLNLRREGIG